MKYYTADGNQAINLRCKQDAGSAGVIADAELGIYEVRLHLSATSAAEDFVVSLDSALGSKYDAVLVTKAMNGLADYCYQPTSGPHYIRAGDEIKITKANAVGLDWSVTVVYD